MVVLLLVAALIIFVAGFKAGADSNQDLDCLVNFTWQEDAQAIYDADPNDPNRLDADHDGEVCESLPHKPTEVRPKYDRRTEGNEP